MVNFYVAKTPKAYLIIKHHWIFFTWEKKIMGNAVLSLKNAISLFLPKFSLKFFVKIYH